MESQVYCPRCSSLLVSASQGFWFCSDCSGTLVSPNAMRMLFDKAAEEGQGDASPVTPIRDPISCPRCQTTMDNTSYMNSDRVFFDHCRRCHITWVDHDELQAAAKMHTTLGVGFVERPTSGLLELLLPEEGKRDVERLKLAFQDTSNSPYESFILDNGATIDPNIDPADL